MADRKQGARLSSGSSAAVHKFSLVCFGGFIKKSAEKQTLKRGKSPLF